MKSPLYDWHLANSAILADFGGWDMPIEYPKGVILKTTESVKSYYLSLGCVLFGLELYFGRNNIHTLFRYKLGLSLGPEDLKYNLPVNIYNGFRNKNRFALKVLTHLESSSLDKEMTVYDIEKIAQFLKIHIFIYKTSGIVYAFETLGDIRKVNFVNEKFKENFKYL